MSVDGIAAVQARISGIQSRFGALDPGSADAGDGSFAAALAAAQGGTSGLGGSGGVLGGSGGLSGSSGMTLGDLLGATGSTGGLGSTDLLGSLGSLGGTGSPGGAADLQGLLDGILAGGTGSGAGAGTAMSSRTVAFLQAAVSQAGDPYVWGAEAQAADSDPSAFDCSELVQWAAGQVGLDLPDGSWLQYLDLQGQGSTISVEEALRTPGALLFSFSEEPRPGGGRPGQAHVAISLGDGRTIEARGRSYGVGTWEAGDRFEYAAVVPGLSL